MKCLPPSDLNPADHGAIMLKYVPFLLLSSFLLTGCWSGLNPVSGKAIYKGQQMVGGQVFLNKKDDKNLNKVIPAGEIKEDGSFEIYTKGQRGAPAGTYTVTFFWAPPKTQDKNNKPKMSFGGAGEGPTRSVLPEKYTKYDKSEIEVTVTSGNNTLEPFELK